MRNALQTTGGAKAARGRKGWSLRRLRVAAAATAVLTATLVGTLLSPLGAPAEAGATTLEVQLGDTTVEVKNVSTVHNSSNPCLYYYGAGSATSTGTGPVKGSSGVYAAVSYGQPTVGNCPDDYGSSPENTGQTSMSLKPSDIRKVNAGETFLIGTMRHINKPIYTGAADLRSNSAYRGEFRIKTAGTIDSVFPWTEEDTVNYCTAKLDKNGHMVVGSYGGEHTDRDSRVSTEYGFNLQQQVGRVGGDYIYDYNGLPLYRSSAGNYYFYSDRQETLHDALGQACSDDYLTIKADRSETVWTDPATRINYQLKIWGFTFGGDNEQCEANPGNRRLNEFFVTPEKRTSYGCLYGSIEQLRPITFQATANADESIRQQLGAPPTFGYTNTSADGSYGKDHWGHTLTPLTPTGWGLGNPSNTSKAYTLLAPNDLAAVTQDKQNLQAVVQPDGTITSSGWYLTGIKCLFVHPPHSPLLLNREHGGGRLDESNNVNRTARSLRLDQSELAVDFTQAAVNCTWNNEYVIASTTLTLVNQVDSGSANPNEWTLSARPKEAGLFGQKTITGASGSPDVTNQKTAGGTYLLEVDNGPNGYVRSGEWTCSGATVKQENGKTYAVLTGGSATCTVRHKAGKTPVAATKTVTGASDGATLEKYRLSYSCGPANGGAAETGSLDLPRDGSPVQIAGLQSGATCTVTEQALDDSGLVVGRSGTFSWGEPTFSVKIGKTGNQQDVQTTPVAAAGDKGPGVRFTVPDSTQGDLSIAVTNKVVPHAAVTKVFNKVAKGQELNGRDTFDQTYTVRVSNPSTVEPLTYTLADATSVPTGTTVNTITVNRQDGQTVPVAPGTAKWETRNVQLPKGQEHVYTVVVNLSAPDAGVQPDARQKCDAQAVTAGKFVRNTASVTTKGDSTAVEADACGMVPANPKFSLAKTPVEVTREPGGNGYVASYQVTVTNTSQVDAKIVADVRDKLDLPASTQVSKVEVREGGAVTRTFTGAAVSAAGGMVLAQAGSGETLAKAVPGQQEGGKRVLGVQVHFTVNAAVPGYRADDYTCGKQRTDGKPAGLVNTALMDGDTDGEGNNTACLSTSALLHFSKVVATPPGNGSTFDVGYTVSVVNQGALPGSTGKVVDQPSFAPGLVVKRVTVAKGGKNPQEVPADNGGYLVTAGETVASGQTLTWEVVVTVSVDPSVPGYSDASLACATDAGSGLLQEGHGLLNKLVTEPGKDVDKRPNHDLACNDVSPNAGRRGFTVIKSGSQGLLEGAEFSLYDTNPVTPGATPVVGGVTPNGQKGSFNVAPQLINREYWLVETKAPAGHNLLAEPVHFKVTDKGIMVLNGNTLGVSTATVTAVADPTIFDTMTIADIESARLPLSGGAGIVPNLVLASLLLGGAAAISARRFVRTRRA